MVFLVDSVDQKEEKEETSERSSNQPCRETPKRLTTGPDARRNAGVREAHGIFLYGRLRSCCLASCYYVGSSVPLAMSSGGDVQRTKGSSCLVDKSTFGTLIGRREALNCTRMGMTTSGALRYSLANKRSNRMQTRSTIRTSH